jgi:hypothetical protein
MAGVRWTHARGPRRRGSALAASVGALGVLVLAALPAAAGAADRRIGGVQNLTDPTGGATVTAELRQRSTNGAVYPVVTVADSGADGICAHGAVAWEHRNGRTYMDYGMWHCGAGTQSQPIAKPERNWRMYRRVSVSAFVDGGQWRTVLMHDFERDRSADRRVSHEREGVTVRKCGLMVELRALVSTAKAGLGGGPAPRKPVRPPKTAGDGVERIGQVQNCVERTSTHVFARTWINLDAGWEFGPAPMRIRTTLVDQRAEQQAGGPGQLGVVTRAPGSSRDGKIPPWYVTRARGAQLEVQKHSRWNEPGSVYVFESQPVERTSQVRGRLYTTRSSFDFVNAYAFKNTTGSPFEVKWAGYGSNYCLQGDCTFEKNEMVWGGGLIGG